MVHTLKSGLLIEVMYVHSSPNPKKPRDKSDSAYRQLVDNVARSFHRRVTFTEIVVVTPDEAVSLILSGFFGTDFLPPVTKNESVGQGWAMTNLGDSFNRRFGRELSLLRALRSCVVLTREDRNEIALKETNISYDELRVLYARPGVSNVEDAVSDAEAEIYYAPAQVAARQGLTSGVILESENAPEASTVPLTANTVNESATTTSWSRYDKDRDNALAPPKAVADEPFGNQRPYGYTREGFEYSRQSD